MNNDYKASAIGFTARVGGMASSGLYEGPTGRHSIRGRATPQGTFHEAPMDQFQVWTVEGKKMLMRNEARQPNYAFWQAVKELA